MYHNTPSRYLSLTHWSQNRWLYYPAPRVYVYGESLVTRMWLLPTSWMCRSHLLGEHGEMHQAAGTIANHEYGEAVMTGYVKDDAPDDVDTTMIRARHRMLAKELERRGYDHDSPLQDFVDPVIGSLGYNDVQVNAGDLARRCAECRARMPTGDEHAKEIVNAGVAVVVYSE